MSRLPSLTLTADTVGPVARGHPWIYASGIQAGTRESQRPPVGTCVRLVDGRGRLVGFGLSDTGAIAVRMLGRHPCSLRDLLAERVGAAAALRAAVVPADTDAYRLIAGAGDGLPGLVVDAYGPLRVVRLYGACWEPHLSLLVEALSANTDATCIARRRGVRRVDGDRTDLETLHGPTAPERLVVTERGVRFLVRPYVGQKTGLFLDQRDNRAMIGQVARGRDVVNLFGYTGGFSVYAALGGARRVVTVDIAAAALDDARENFRLNDLDPDRHGFEAADAFHWRAPAPLGLLICDPPSLAPRKTSESAAARVYGKLATRTGAMVARGGLLATASCTARLAMPRWRRAIRDGLARSGRWSWLRTAQEPPDHPVAMEHPEGLYLKFALLARR